MYPDLNIPVWEIPILGGYFWVKKSPREHQLNAMGTLFGLHPTVPWKFENMDPYIGFL